MIMTKVKDINLMLTMIIFSLVLSGLFGGESFASEVGARVEWQYRDNVHGAHPSEVQQLENGNLLMVLNGYVNPRVIEVTRQGEVVWKYEGIQANSARRLANGNTLIADSGAPGYPFVPRVLEVQPGGEIAWQYRLSSRSQAPTGVGVLQDGSFLITARDRVFQLNRQGQVGFVLMGEKLKLLNVIGAKELPTGNILIVDQGLRGGDGQVLEVTRAGEVVRHFTGLNRPVDALRRADGQVLEVTRAGEVVGLNRPVDALRRADGNTLILDLGLFQMREYDQEGIWREAVSYQALISELSVMNQWRAQILPSGHFLLALSYTNGQSLVMEINDRVPKLQLNGQELSLAGSLFMTEGRLFVPMREVFDLLGIKVHWDNELKAGLATWNGTEIHFITGSRDMTVNGVPGQLGAAPRLLGSQAYIPVGLLLQGFGITVQWDEANRTGNIIFAKQVEQVGDGS